MKRFLALVLVLISLAGTVYADTVDLSGMTYDELVALKDKINLAIWNSQEWQEVTVPQGVWKVGEDIPAGHWTIKTNAPYAMVKICTTLNKTGKDADIWNSDFYEVCTIANPNNKNYDPNKHVTEIDYNLESGTYVIVDDGTVIFTPYAGKPNLGFK